MMRGKWIIAVILAMAALAGFSMALVMKKQAREHHERIERQRPGF